MNPVPLIYFGLQSFRLQFLQLLLTAFVLVVFGAFSSIFTRSALAFSWEDVFRSEPPVPSNDGGSRGDRDTFCPIAPIPPLDASGNAISSAIVYSDRPLLLWQGATERIELWQRGGDRPLWTHSISEADRVKETAALTDQITYQVTAPTPLQPDQRYEWRIYPPGLDYSIARFRTVSLEERDRIRQELDGIIAGQTAPAATIRRADYFAGQQMWSDFWQTLLTGQPPSQELVALNGNTIAALCPLVSASSILSIPNPTRPPEATHPFNAEANQTIELSLDSPEAPTQFTLLDPQGTTIATGTAQPNRPISQQFTLPLQGQYKVRLQAAETPSQNQYTLTVTSRFNVQ
ncbi:PPC domain-containing protein [Leptolyngbya ohadii]|uniref:PPC domain-containing protein n=1 Tax=Leptolyngbya ohadii TaxID=1962290 RepID=UPI000B5A15BA|nr:PPC domain-containing protein [Leptolyngbya ohadii]